MGLATARIATAHGDRVAVLARNIEVPGLSSAVGDQGLVLAADVSDPGSVSRAVAAVVDHWGGVDVLVNNAGLHRGGRAAELALEDWQAVIDTNLSGPLHCVRAVLPHMPEGGSIVNVGAVVGFRGFPGDSAYGASKAGLAGLTRVLAMELARQKLRVNLVVPGLVLTEMVAELDDRARDRLIAKIPLRRMGSEEEIAEVIWWVAGSSYMTGAIIPTDGGLMCAL